MGKEYLILERLERFKDLQKNLGIFNWTSRQWNSGKEFEEKMPEIKTKLPFDLSLAWEKSYMAREELSRILKKYGLGDLY